MYCFIDKLEAFVLCDQIVEVVPDVTLYLGIILPSPGARVSNPNDAE